MVKNIVETKNENSSFKIPFLIQYFLVNRGVSRHGQILNSTVVKYSIKAYSHQIW